MNIYECLIYNNTVLLYKQFIMHYKIDMVVIENVTEVTHEMQKLRNT